MAEVGNLDIYLGVTLVFFIIANVGNLLKKITDPMAIMIRVAELMARCF
jgi:hypothetical protein